MLTVTLHFNSMEEAANFLLARHAGVVSTTVRETKPEKGKPGRKPKPDSVGGAVEVPVSDQKDNYGITETRTYSREDVRLRLGVVNATPGLGAEAVKTLFSEFGAAKLSDIKEEEYGELMARAGQLLTSA